MTPRKSCDVTILHESYQKFTLGPTASWNWKLWTWVIYTSWGNNSHSLFFCTWRKMLSDLWSQLLTLEALRQEALRVTLLHCCPQDRNKMLAAWFGPEFSRLLWIGSTCLMTEKAILKATCTVYPSFCFVVKRLSLANPNPHVFWSPARTSFREHLFNVVFWWRVCFNLVVCTKVCF